MPLIQPNPYESKILLQALLSVVKGSVSLSLLQAAQDIWLKTRYDLSLLKWQPLSPEATAASLPDPDQRLQLIQAMIVLVILDESPQWQIYQKVASYCRSFQIPESRLGLLWLWCCQWRRLLALTTYWQSFVVEKYRYELKKRGWGWLFRGALSYLGWWPDLALAQRYYRLQTYSPGTLGNCFWQFCRQHDYTFPGERWGLHEGLSFHDMTHVLGGFGIDPLGELQAVAMTAGYKRSGDPVATLLFILLQQQLGIQVGVLTQPQRGVLNQPQAPEAFIRSLFAGSRMMVDLSEDWDPWSVMDLSLEDLRDIYNLQLY